MKKQHNNIVQNNSKEKGKVNSTKNKKSQY